MGDQDDAWSVRALSATSDDDEGFLDDDDMEQAMQFIRADRNDALAELLDTNNISTLVPRSLIVEAIRLGATLCLGAIIDAMGIQEFLEHIDDAKQLERAAKNEQSIARTQPRTNRLVRVKRCVRARETHYLSSHLCAPTNKCVACTQMIRRVRVENGLTSRVREDRPTCDCHNPSRGEMCGPEAQASLFNI